MNTTLSQEESVFSSQAHSWYFSQPGRTEWLHGSPEAEENQGTLFLDLAIWKVFMYPF